jgi:hypothetical protein
VLCKEGRDKKQIILWRIVGRNGQGKRNKENMEEESRKKEWMLGGEENRHHYLRLMQYDYAIRCTQPLKKLRHEQG